ncbi:MAG: hypothetical protein ACK4TA_01875 [Saprospiraceae bacterium]
MLSLFRTNQLLFSLLLVFYVAVLHVAAFLVPYEWEPMGYGYLSKIVYEAVGHQGTIPAIICILLLFVHATVINVIMANNRVDDTVTLFPGVFYILIASALPRFLDLTPIHMANTFYVFAISELFKVYKKPAAADNIFNVGFWIGVASLFYFSYIIFILLAFVGLGILRAFNLQERIMVLIGALVPYILTGVYLFWNDQWEAFVQYQFIDSISFLDFRIESNVESVLKIIFVDIFLVVAIFSYTLYIFKKNIQVQKKISVLYWSLLFSAVTILFQAGVQLDHLLILAVPLGMMISINFTHLSSRWAEVLHLIIILIILIFQYQQYLLPD